MSKSTFHKSTHLYTYRLNSNLIKKEQIQTHNAIKIRKLNKSRVKDD